MLNRLFNALATRAARDAAEIIAAKTRAERSAEAQHARELINEMEDVLEKFSRVVAREGMRRSREAKRLMEERELAEHAAGGPAGAQEPAGATNDLAARKNAARARLRARGGPQALTGNSE